MAFKIRVTSLMPTPHRFWAFDKYILANGRDIFKRLVSQQDLFVRLNTYHTCLPD